MVNIPSMPEGDRAIIESFFSYPESLIYANQKTKPVMNEIKVPRPLTPEQRRRLKDILKPKPEMNSVIENDDLKIDIPLLKTDINKLYDDNDTGEIKAVFNPLEYGQPQQDEVNHPSYYNQGKIEVIDFIEDQKLGFHLGNVVKYSCRAGKKQSSTALKDLEKAKTYLDRKIQLLKEGGEL
jgi:hypothetical protein